MGNEFTEYLIPIGSHKNDEYQIELKTNYYNSKRHWSSEDNRDLSIALILYLEVEGKTMWISNIRQQNRAQVKNWICVIYLFLFVLAVMAFCYPFEGILKVPYYASSDAAANSLLIQKAKKWNLFTGNYSRVGFYHPEPFFYYIQAVFEWLFFDLLHLVPGAFNADIIGMAVFYAFCIVLSVYFLRREYELKIDKILLLYAVALGLNVTVIFRFMWPPVWYMISFLPFTIAFYFTLLRKYIYLKWFVFFSCVLVHGHVCFAMFAVGCSLLVVADALKKYGLRKWFQENRPYILCSCFIIAVFVLPMIIETIISFPGELPYYIGYAEAGPTKTKRTFYDAVEFLFGLYQVWGKMAFAFSCFFVMAVLVLVNEKKDYLKFLCMAFYLNALTLLYVFFQVDDLKTMQYTCWFIYEIYIVVILYSFVLFIRLPQFGSEKIKVACIGIAIVVCFLAYDNIKEEYCFGSSTNLSVQVDQLKEHLYKAGVDKGKKQQITIIQLDNAAWPGIVSWLSYNEIYDGLNLKVKVYFGESRALECMYTPEKTVKKIADNDLCVYAASTEELLHFYSDGFKENIFPINGAYFAYAGSGEIIDQRIDPVNSNISGIKKGHGFYAYEKTHVWVQKECEVYLKNDKISQNGILIDFTVPEQVLAEGADQVQVYINDTLAYSDFVKQAGEKSVFIDPKKNGLLGNTDTYKVEIKSEKCFNPSRVGESSDDRDLALMVSYIGEKK